MWENAHISVIRSQKANYYRDITVEVGGKQSVASSDSVSANNDKYFIGEGGFKKKTTLEQ